MILRVDPDDPTPVYEQIRSQIQTMVTAGVLAPGSRLPTIRQLSSDLGLAKGTVSRAYEMLLGNGTIESHGRRGTTVALAPRVLPQAERLALLGSVTEQLVLTSRQLGMALDDVIRAVELAWAESGRGVA